MESSDSTYSPFAKTATSGEVPNPLRPYYIPPSIDFPADGPSSTSGGSFTSFPGPSASQSGRDFRDLFNDLDYGDYISDQAPSLGDLIARLRNEAMWSYSSVLLAQPFEVAKIILQTYDANRSGNTLGATEGQNGIVTEEKRVFEAEGYFDSDSDDTEAPSYFQPTSPHETPSHRPARRKASRQQSTQSSTSQPGQMIILKNPNSVLEVLGHLWTTERQWGWWKGTNSTFVYGVLLKTVENWTRGCINTILGLPETTLSRGGIGTGILDSPNPVASVGVVVVAAGFAGLLLAPVDMVRTKLIVTPRSQGPRALLPSLRELPSLVVPSSILPITLLNSTVPTLISSSAPLFLRNTFRLDPLQNSALYSFASFLVTLGEVFVKLPLETVMRRSHIFVLQNPAQQDSKSTILPLHNASTGQKFRTIVPVGPYKGTLATIFHICYDEGYRTVPGSVPPSRSSSRSSSTHNLRGRRLDSRKQQQQKRGQGLQGLWRGWRIPFWGLVGYYLAAGAGERGATQF